MALKHKRKRPMAEINVVPYIDVMLVLLVIFMITTPLLSQGVKIDLPQAQSQTIATKDREPLIISVNAEGQYFLNVATDPNAPLSAQALATQVAAQLQLAAQQGQPLTVLVKGDRQVNYGQVVQAMVLLQHAGAKSVGLMTESPQQQTTAVG